VIGLINPVLELFEKEIDLKEFQLAAAIT